MSSCCLHVEITILLTCLTCCIAALSLCVSHMPCLFTDKYNDFIDANRIEDAEDRLKTMKKLVCVKGQQDKKQ